MNRDFDNAVWHTSMLCAMGGKIVPDIEAGAMAGFDEGLLSFCLHHARLYGG